MDKQNELEITALNCEGTNLRNSNRFHFIPVMSYSRTYRRSNGVDMNQTNINARQRAGGPETGEGSNEDEVNRRHTEIPKQERQESTVSYPDCKQTSAFDLPVRNFVGKHIRVYGCFLLFFL